MRILMTSEERNVWDFSSLIPQFFDDSSFAIFGFVGCFCVNSNLWNLLITSTMGKGCLPLNVFFETCSSNQFCSKSIFLWGIMRREKPQQQMFFLRNKPNKLFREFFFLWSLCLLHQLVFWHSVQYRAKTTDFHLSNTPSPYLHTFNLENINVHLGFFIDVVCGFWFFRSLHIKCKIVSHFPCCSMPIAFAWWERFLSLAGCLLLPPNRA